MLIVSSEVREVDCLQNETFFFSSLFGNLLDSRWIVRIKK